MKIISRSALRALWERAGCEDAKQPLLSWFKEIENATWKSPADVKKLYGSADIVGVIPVEVLEAGPESAG